MSCDVVMWFPAERLLMGTSSFWNSRSEVSCFCHGVSWKSLYIFAPVFALCEIECDNILSCVNRVDIVTNIYVKLATWFAASKMWCIILNIIFFFLLWRRSPTRAMASSFLMRFLDHTQRRTTVGRTTLDEWSVRRRDLYRTNHNTHNRQTSMPPARFEPTTISVGERPQTYVLTFRHRASSIQDRRFATLQRTLFIYLINKYILLSYICLTVHHWYK